MPHRKPFTPGGFFRYLFVVALIIPCIVSANSVEMRGLFVHPEQFALETVNEFVALIETTGAQSGRIVGGGGRAAHAFALQTVTEFLDTIGDANKKVHKATYQGIASAGDAFLSTATDVAEGLLEGFEETAHAFALVMQESNDAGYAFGEEIGKGFDRIGNTPDGILAAVHPAIEAFAGNDFGIGSVVYEMEDALRDSGSDIRQGVVRLGAAAHSSNRVSRGLLPEASRQIAAVNALPNLDSIGDSIVLFFSNMWGRFFGGDGGDEIAVSNQTPPRDKEVVSNIQPTGTTPPPTVVVFPSEPPSPPIQPVYIPSYLRSSSISIADVAVMIGGLRNELTPLISRAMRSPHTELNDDSSDVDLSGYLALTGGTLTGALIGTDGTFSDDLAAATLAVTGSTTLNGVEYLFPSADGTDNYVLTTDGNGALTWEAAAVGGITSLGGLSGASQTFASSSDTNIGLTIVSSGSTHTFTPSWIGTLAAGRGGTGTSTVNANELLIGNSAGTAWTTVATSSLGIISDHGGLTGLTDDDHTQYALLAGRSGGQTLIGGTGASESLTFNSTSHGTKGLLKFVGSGVNGSMSITNSSGAAQFNFFADDTGSNGAKVRANQFVATNGTFFLAEDFATFRMSSAGSITFASGVSATDNAADIGLARDSAGILRISNGSTGGGALLADYFSATSTTATSTFAGVLHPTGKLADTAGSGGSSGQLLQSTGTGLSWVATTSLGFGNVVGPASATDNAIARFDLTTGKIIQNSGITIEDTNRVGLASNVFISGEGNNFQTFSDSGATGYASMRTGDSRFHLYSTTGTVRFALLPSADQFQIGNNSTITWSANATDPGTGIDVGLVRDSAGVLRVSDGTAGGGALKASYFTATSTTATSTFAGVLHPTGKLADTAGSGGDAGMVLTSTGTGLDWVATSSLGITVASEWTDGGSFDYDLENVYVGTSTLATNDPRFAVGTSSLDFFVASSTGWTYVGNDKRLVIQSAGSSDWSFRNIGGNRLVVNDVFDRIMFDGNSGGMAFASTGALSWTDSGLDPTGTGDLMLRRDDAGVLAIRNAANQQTLNLYNTQTNSSNYERLSLSGSQGNYVSLSAQTAGTGGDNLHVLLTPAGTGNVGIATTTPGYKLTVTGTVGFDGLSTGSGDAVCIDTVTKEIQYNSGADTCLASSLRFKHDIEDLSLDLSDLRKLRAVSYKENATGEERIGFIAEEVEDVDARLMFYEPNGNTPRGVRYEDIVALVVKSIQELADRLDAIEEQLAAAGQSVSGSIGNFVELIVQKITADEVNTNKLCIGETCVTENELKDLLNDADIKVPSVPEEEPREEETPPEETPNDETVLEEGLPEEEQPAEDKPLEEEGSPAEETSSEEPAV